MNKMGGVEISRAHRYKLLHKLDDLRQKWVDKNHSRKNSYQNTQLGKAGASSLVGAGVGGLIAVPPGAVLGAAVGGVISYFSSFFDS